MKRCWVLDDKVEQLEAYYGRYEQEYNTSFDISQGEYEELSEEAKAQYDAAYKALSEDPEVLALYPKIVSQTFLIVTVSLLAAFLLLEFGVPLLLGEGRTLGKKVFGLAVVRSDLVRVSGPVMFVRTVLGKYTLETMIPVYVLIMLLFNVAGLLGIVIVIALLVTQLILYVTSRTGMLHASSCSMA